LDEVAVMIDTRDAVEIAPLPQGVEWPGYVESWRAAKAAE
jgi:homogentisate 1,2-dioxygenase